MNIRIPVIFGVIAAAVVFLPAQANAAPANLTQNPGFETVGSASNAALNWQPFQNGYTRVAGGHTGSWSIQLKNTSSSALAGAYQRIDLHQTTLKPVFIGGYVKGSSITMASGSWFGASIYAEIHMIDGSVAYWNSVPNSGTFGWRWVGFNTGTLSSVNQPIDYVFVVPILGRATGTAVFDDIAVREYVPENSAVTIMIDDGESTTYTVALPAMSKREIPGTTAISTGQVGDSGYMNQAQIKELQTKGWEIVSHGVNHLDLTTLSQKKQKSELESSLKKLTSWGLKVQNFAFPFGAYNAAIVDLADNYYASVRAYELGDNPAGTFPYEVKVRSVTSSVTPQQVGSWIQQAQANGRWELLVFHSLTASGDDEYHTSPATFSQILDVIQQSGIRVLTYQRGIELFGTTR